jgi:two-component system sensor histidine kinase/response regulator
MNAIIGMTDIVLDTRLGAEQQECLEIVRVSADALLKVINDLLDFSKIEAGKLSLDPHDFHLDDCIGDTLKPLALRAHKIGLNIAYEIDPDVPHLLIGDPGRLRQILINLIGNAIKFTSRGEIAVRVGLDAPADGEACLHFAVADTGIGIPADRLQAVFEPFVQADGSTSRKYGGTGLGLTISSRLVDLMGGKIWAESEVGKGTTFHFTARMQLQAPTESAQPLALSRWQGLPVLVMDESATNRRILAGLLSSLGLKPTALDGAAAALAEIASAEEQQAPYPLVVVDGGTPEKDGFALVQRLNEIRSQGGATLMMLSSADWQADVARCRELAIAAHVTKPAKRAELVKAIALALEGGHPATSEDDGAVISAAKQSPVRRLNILLTDDNEFNRRVGLIKLEKRGHTVKTVGSGKEALSALEQSAYDLVFMDVQMPDMDGLEVTAIIRSKESATGRHVPIIAMTAHAMKGDRERFIAAGMDGYVAKPVRDQELWEAIAAVVPADAGAEPCEPCEPPAPPALDRDAVLARVGGNLKLLRELTDVFGKDCSSLTGEIRAALDRRELGEAVRPAHTLKGVVGFFGTPAATQASLELETLAKKGDVDGASAALGTLLHAIQDIQQSLAVLAAPEPSSAGEAIASPAHRETGGPDGAAPALQEAPPVR